jgi:hypothetical protein
VEEQKSHNFDSYSFKVQLSVSFFLFITFILGTVSNSAWSDDYSAFHEPYEVRLHAIKDGRPLYGLAIQYLYQTISTVDELKLIRLLGLIGIVLANLIVVRQLQSKSLKLAGPIASTLAFTIPSFQLSAHWAIGFSFSWSTFFALIGLLHLQHKQRFRIFAGVLLFIISLLVYPLNTFFIFSFLFALAIVSKASIGEYISQFYRASSFLALGVLISTLLCWFYLKVESTPTNPRVAFVTLEELPEKVVWFVSRPLVLSFMPFQIVSPTLTHILVSVLPITLVVFFFTIPILYYIEIIP